MYGTPTSLYCTSGLIYLLPCSHSTLFSHNLVAFNGSLSDNWKIVSFKQQHWNHSPHRHRYLLQHSNSFTHLCVHPSICPVKQCFVSVWEANQPGDKSRLLNELLISPVRTHTYTQNSQGTVASISPIVSLSVSFSSIKLLSEWTITSCVLYRLTQTWGHLICLNCVLLLLHIIWVISAVWITAMNTSYLCVWQTLGP